MSNFFHNRKTKNSGKENHLLNKASHYYPGVNIPHCNISAFMLCVDTVILSLKDESILRVMPVEIHLFREWLLRHEIREITLHQ